MQNVTEGIPAEGTWPQDIVVSAQILYDCAKVPPVDDKVIIKIVDDKLFVGSAATLVHTNG